MVLHVARSNSPAFTLVDDCHVFCSGSGRNPRRQQKKMKAKERNSYLGYSGYDSSEDFGSSPYVR